MPGYFFAVAVKLKSTTIHFDFSVNAIEMDAETFFVDDFYVPLVVKDCPIL